MQPTLTSHILRAGDGDKGSILGDLINRKGRLPFADLYLAQCTVPPGAGVPVHAHPSPETFILLAGALHVTFGDGHELHSATLAPGDILKVAASEWHAYRAVGECAAVFITLYDGSLERFFAAVADVPSDAPPTPERVGTVMRVAAEHGMQIRG